MQIGTIPATLGGAANRHSVDVGACAALLLFRQVLKNMEGLRTFRLHMIINKADSLDMENMYLSVIKGLLSDLPSSISSFTLNIRGGTHQPGSISILIYLLVALTQEQNLFTIYFYRRTFYRHYNTYPSDYAGMSLRYLISS